MIKNILFDIGNVLLSFEREPTIETFSRYSRKFNRAHFGIDKVFISGYWERMETGEISPMEYFEEFREESGCEMDFEQFRLIWTMHFTPIEEMIAFGRRLAENYLIFFFSNTDPIHIPPLYNRFTSLLFFHGQALSWELGVRKPDPEFFRLGLARFGLDPAECLFIDDRPENVESAARLGIHSVQFLDPPQAIAAMRHILNRV